LAISALNVRNVACTGAPALRCRPKWPQYTGIERRAIFAHDASPAAACIIVDHYKEYARGPAIAMSSSTRTQVSDVCQKLLRSDHQPGASCAIASRF